MFFKDLCVYIPKMPVRSDPLFYLIMKYANWASLSGSLEVKRSHDIQPS